MSDPDWDSNNLFDQLNAERALADDLAADLAHLEDELRKAEGILPVIFPRSTALARYREARQR